MLRACHDVLKRGGRVAGFTIHAPFDLAPRDRARAAELGPSEVLSEAPYAELLERAGFELVLEEDVTEDFRATCEGISEARRAAETRLRREEGDAAFDETRESVAQKLEGISSGLLQRMLIAGRKM